jgi:dihydroflavonol-4-reductase
MGHPIRHVLGDVTDTHSVSQAVRDQEIVIHAAAAVGYAPSEALQPINEGGTRNVVSACRRLRVKRLVHISSVAAIGIPEDRCQPADETFVFNLERSALGYHISKRRAEEVVSRAVAEGLDAVIVNPSSIKGPHGQYFRGSELLDGVRRRPVVPCFSGGTNVVHVDDVVDGVLSALRHGRTGERYILAGENLTWREMAGMAADLLGVRRVFVAVPSIATGIAAGVERAIGPLSGNRPRFTYDLHFCAKRFLFYDSRKAREQLGFKARSYADILIQYLDRSWSRASPRR